MKAERIQKMLKERAEAIDEADLSSRGCYSYCWYYYKSGLHLQRRDSVLRVQQHPRLNEGLARYNFVVYNLAATVF